MILGLEPETFHKVVQKVKVEIRWQMKKVTEFIKPLQCYKCHKCGHLGTHCKNEQFCSKCVNSGHNSINNKGTASSINYRTYNDRFQTDYKLRHEDRIKNCADFEQKINNKNLQFQNERIKIKFKFICVHMFTKYDSVHNSLVTRILLQKDFVLRNNL